jgi:hypothetical protein
MARGGKIRERPLSGEGEERREGERREEDEAERERERERERQHTLRIEQQPRRCQGQQRQNITARPVAAPSESH